MFVAFSIAAAIAVLVALRRSVAWFAALLLLLSCTPVSYPLFVDVGTFSLHVADLALVVGLAHWWANRDSKDAWLRRPLSVFLGAAIASGLYARVVHGISWSTIGRDELRPLMYYGLVGILLVETKTPEKVQAVRRVVDGVVLLSAALLLAQEFLVRDLLFVRGRLDPLWQYPELELLGLNRLITPADGLLFMMFFVYWAELLVAGVSARRWLLLACCGFGQFISYNRSSWVAMFVTSVAMMWVLRGGVRPRVVLWRGTALVAALVLVGTIVGRGKIAGAGRAVVERVASMAAETSETGTLQQRVVEVAYAWDAIRAQPVIGMGLGATYRGPWGTSEYELSGTGGRFVHVGYVYLLLKMGLVGLIAYSVLVLRVLSQLYRLSLSGRAGRMMTVGALWSGIAFLIANLVSFHVVELQWVVAFALVTAIGVAEGQCSVPGVDLVAKSERAEATMPGDRA